MKSLTLKSHKEWGSHLGETKNKQARELKRERYQFFFSSLFHSINSLNESETTPIHVPQWRDIRKRKINPQQKEIRMAYQRVRSILLLAHHPWDSSFKTYRHLSSPFGIRFPWGTYFPFYWSIFILNLSRQTLRQTM